MWLHYEATPERRSSDSTSEGRRCLLTILLLGSVTSDSTSDRECDEASTLAERRCGRSTSARERKGCESTSAGRRRPLILLLLGGDVV